MSTHISSPHDRRRHKVVIKCFHCRKSCSERHSRWHPWNSMEVLLCEFCEQLTRNFGERREGELLQQERMMARAG